MSRILQRRINTVLPVAAGGEGIYIFDKQGNRYIDASGGAAVSCLGHNDPEVVQAIKDQLDKLEYAHTGFFTSEPAEALAEDLIGNAPDGIGWVYFVSGGSEAVEAALKMARQYFVEIGQPQRSRFIARRQSYHGNTLGALAVGGNMRRRDIYEPLLMEASFISPCYAYRGQRDDETEEDYGRRMADELEAEILNAGPDTVAAFIAETVVGATLGAVPAVPGYFRRIREICDKYGVLLILDEVMSGMGRTGTLHACEQEGVSPDFLTMAKGLGGGYQPIGAVLVSQPVVEAFRDGRGFFQHGHTYMAHPVACAAALAVQRSIRDRGLLAEVRRLGGIFRDGLNDRLGQHPHIGDIRGRGLFWGLELVAARDSKTPFDPALKLHARIKQNAMDRGLICYPEGGTADGERGDHVLLAPPYIVNEAQTEEIIEGVSQAIDTAIQTATASVSKS